MELSSAAYTIVENIERNSKSINIVESNFIVFFPFLYYIIIITK